MDAVKFLEARKRMCSELTCDYCPLNYGGACICFCKASSRFEDSKEIVRTVEEWVKNNPVKTRQSELLKVFPKAEMLDGVVQMCPKMMDTKFPCQVGKCSCIDCKKGYWFEEVE